MAPFPPVHPCTLLFAVSFLLIAGSPHAAKPPLAVEDDCPSSLSFEDAMGAGIAKNKARAFSAAASCFSRAVSLKPSNAGALTYLGEASLRMGDLQRAISSLSASTTIAPRHVAAHLLLASASQKAGDIYTAKEAYERALEIQPDSAPALVNYGTLLRAAPSASSSRRSLDMFKSAAHLHPSLPEAHHNMADLLFTQGDAKSALRSALTALSLRPTMTQAHAVAAVSLEALGEYSKALSQVEVGLRLVAALGGDVFTLMYHQARLLKAVGRVGDARAAFESCISERWAGSGSAQIRAYAHNEYGHLLSELGSEGDAGEQYLMSVQVDPSFARGWVNVASARAGGGINGQIEALEKAISLEPSLTEAWINKGQVYYNNFRHAASHMRSALSAFSRALEISPSSSSALFSLARVSVDLCKWDAWIETFEQVRLKIESELASGSILRTSISMVYLLVFPIPDDALQKVYTAKAESVALTAKSIVRDFFGGGRKGDVGRRRVRRSLSEGDGEKNSRLKIGYLSADFQEHPVGLLFASVPSLHNKSAIFDTACLSLQSPSRGGKPDRIADALRESCGEWQDLQGESLGEAYGKIERIKSDILVEMNGYTQHARPELVASSTSPLRISLLGFAHSLMGDFIDFLATDALASPPELWQGSYSERAIYFPSTFYLTNHAQSFHSSHLAPHSSLPATSRAQVGLDSGFFTFASFNQPFKISPRIFETWMRMMQRVPLSQLWLLKLNEGEAAEEALRSHALSMGISPSRLHFTGSASLDDHIAYKSAADLMLDTDTYNAHSTAADTLWAGVPVLTMASTRMAGRIGASISRGAGLNDILVARDLLDYEELGVRLATCSACLERVRQRLVKSRGGLPLFDTKAWLRKWEAGLKIAWETGGGSHHVVITGTEGALPLERSDAQQAQGSNSYPSSIQSRSLPRGQVPEGTGGGTTDDFGQNKKQAVALDMPVYADEIDVGQQTIREINPCAPSRNVTAKTPEQSLEHL